MGVAEESRPTYRYGEFPELFWDARPDEVVDPENPIVLTRVLTQGSADAIAKLVRPEALERLLPTLVIPEHSRRFWNVVLEEFREAGLLDPVEIHPESARVDYESTVHSRAGWSNAARLMTGRGEDALLDLPTPTRFDAEEWTW